MQKSLVVNLVKKSVKAKTLAIGDGANDVSMLKAADIGVGISGQEGLQAVLASDYSLGQFRFLRRLILVHGRWSYHRVTWMILYFFYKNYAFVLANFWFSIFSGYSAQTVYENTYIMFYNLIFTSIPPMVFAVFDQDLSAQDCLRHPELYQYGIANSKFNSKIFWWTVVDSIYQSLWVFFVPLLVSGGTYGNSSQKNSESIWVRHVAFGGSTSIVPSGKSSSLWVAGAVMYLSVTTVVNLKVALDTHNWTALSHASIWGSIVAVFLYVIVFSFYPAYWIPGFGNVAFGIMTELFTSANFWFCLVLIVVGCLAPKYVQRWISLQIYPSAVDIIREMSILQIGTRSETDETLYPLEEKFVSSDLDTDSSQKFTQENIATEAQSSFLYSNDNAMQTSPSSISPITLSQKNSRGTQSSAYSSSQPEIKGSLRSIDRLRKDDSLKIGGSNSLHQRSATTELGSNFSGTRNPVLSMTSSAIFLRHHRSSRGLNSFETNPWESTLSDPHHRRTQSEFFIRSLGSTGDNLHHRQPLGHRRPPVITIENDLNFKQKPHTGFAFN